MDFDNCLENQRHKLDLQEIPVAYECDGCKSEIYNGNEYFVEEGYILCEDCYDEIQRKQKEEASHIAGEEQWED